MKEISRHAWQWLLAEIRAARHLQSKGIAMPRQVAANLDCVPAQPLALAKKPDLDPKLL